MALFGQNLPKFGLYLAGCCNSWKSLKNLKVGVLETDFKQVPFVFRKTGLKRERERKSQCTIASAKVAPWYKKYYLANLITYRYDSHDSFAKILAILKSI